MKQALRDAAIEMSIPEARAKVAEYVKGVRERHRKEDQAILRGYRALAKGHQVIDLPHVIGLGGVHEKDQLPRLAVATASHSEVFVQRDSEGAVAFLPGARWEVNPRRIKDCYRLPKATLPAHERSSVPNYGRGGWNHPWEGNMRAVVPHVPPSLMPAHDLSGYQVLFEVDEWTPTPRVPKDPALLKHIGGDLYAVLATWDLTELERLVLQGLARD